MDQSKSFSSFWKKLLIFSLALAITFLGGKLRFHQYNVYPNHGDTYDEYKAPFSGLGLIYQGVPTSWSWYPEYQDVIEKRYIGNGLFRIVKPWFDEPFLFSYLAGLYSKANDIKKFDEVDIDLYRQAMVYSNCLNILLLFVLAVSYTHLRRRRCRNIGP